MYLEEKTKINYIRIQFTQLVYYSIIKKNTKAETQGFLTNKHQRLKERIL